jgi:hypothetical protein
LAGFLYDEGILMVKSAAPIQHLVLRYGEHFCPSGDTIKEHLIIFRRYDKFVWGKFGFNIAKTRLALFRRQIESGQPTYLYLAKVKNQITTLHKARIVDFKSQLEASEHKYVPEYYRQRIDEVTVWVLCSSLEDSTNKLSSLSVASSHSPLAHALVTSMCPQFFVIAERGFLLSSPTDDDELEDDFDVDENVDDLLANLDAYTDGEY